MNGTDGTLAVTASVVRDNDACVAAAMVVLGNMNPTLQNVCSEALPDAVHDVESDLGSVFGRTKGECGIALPKSAIATTSTRKMHNHVTSVVCSGKKNFRTCRAEICLENPASGTSSGLNRSDIDMLEHYRFNETRSDSTETISDCEVSIISRTAHNRGVAANQIVEQAEIQVARDEGDTIRGEIDVLKGGASSLYVLAATTSNTAPAHSMNKDGGNGIDHDTSLRLKKKTRSASGELVLPVTCRRRLRSATRSSGLAKLFYSEYRGAEKRLLAVVFSDATTFFAATGKTTNLIPDNMWEGCLCRSSNDLNPWLRKWPSCRRSAKKVFTASLYNFDPHVFYLRDHERTGIGVPDMEILEPTDFASAHEYVFNKF